MGLETVKSNVKAATPAPTSAPATADTSEQDDLPF
jgi:hypothetical protein